MIRERQAVRAILLTPEQEVLLLRIRETEDSDCFWITPGGGIEPGEAMESALRRELREELGLAGFAIGPLVWRRQHTFTWDGERICQSEDYHIVHIARFEPCTSDAPEARWLDGFRWWSVTELAHPSERLSPLSLPQIVARYLENGPPREPLGVEVLVD